MRLPLVVLFASVALLGASGGAVAADGHGVVAADGHGVVAADGQNAPPPWPGNDTVPENNTTSVQPGQQLAGAVGAQGASVEGELWNRTLTDRLDNASTPSERAMVIAEETETIEEYIEALDEIRANMTQAWDDDEIGEGQYRATLSAFVVRAHTVELRANQTAKAAENLSVIVRDTQDVNVTHVRNLSERAHDLYQFEGEVEREVVNETLRNESALAGIPVEADVSNRTDSSEENLNRTSVASD